MKYLLFILTIFIFSCEKDTEVKPNVAKNIVFYATAGGHTITIPDVGTFFIDKDPGNTYPQCASSYDTNSKYLITYLREGRYKITFPATFYDKLKKEFYITVKQGCNTFDVSNVYAWN